MHWCRKMSSVSSMWVSVRSAQAALSSASVSTLVAGSSDPSWANAAPGDGHKQSERNARKRDEQ